MLESTLAAGLCSVGADVELLGVIPTPGVAYLVRKYNADAGIMISASHNPMEFNGIKIFKGDGYKLPDEVENRNRSPRLQQLHGHSSGRRARTSASINDVHAPAVKDYVDYPVSERIDADLTGLKVPFDCANGASARPSRRQSLPTPWAASARIIGDPARRRHRQPTAAAPPIWKRWKRRVRNRAATIAASPLTATRTAAWRCDENGAEIDGDKIIAICAGTDMKERGQPGREHRRGHRHDQPGLHRSSCES